MKSNFDVELLPEAFSFIKKQDKTRWTETIVFATHGFKKKTDKVAKKEIAKAEKTRKEYFKSKS